MRRHFENSNNLSRMASGIAPLLLVALFSQTYDKCLAGTGSITAPIPTRSNVDSAAPPAGTMQNPGSPFNPGLPSTPAPGAGTAPSFINNAAPDMPVGTTSGSTPGSALLRPELHAGGRGGDSSAGNTQQGGVQTAQPYGTGDATVESFFDVKPAAPILIPRAKKARDRVVPPLSSARTASRADDGSFHSGRFMWHVLDNLGVPLPIGNDPDIDPTIGKSMIMPPTVIGPDGTVRRGTTAGTGGDAPMKSLKYNPAIPEGELEGTDVPAMKDAQPSSK